MRQELKEILKKHELWVNNDECGEKADLSGMDLKGANLDKANLKFVNLVEADLRGASLRGTNLEGADLEEVNLMGANLVEADLSQSNLRGASLYGANLKGANLIRANLKEANLEGANLKEASLREADLAGANLSQTKGLELFKVVPEQDGFTMWKKVTSKGKNYIIKLGIPQDAKRVNAYTSRKIRVNKAKVLLIEDMEGNIIKDRELKLTGINYYTIDYYLGAEITEDNYDGDPRMECVPGIHGFLTKQEALNWCY